jgi:drug/metabolite transporter (DMT)-like permease
MGVLLALGAAVAYGVSDFLGGVVSRRTSVWPVALLSCAGGLLGSLALAAALPGDPTRADVLWGALAGTGSGIGTAFLYRGFANGRMGVVAPVSAVGAAVLPLSVGVLAGERPSTLAWLGLVVALPAIWLVSREPGAHIRAGAPGLLDGVLAGIGFGGLFAAMGQVPTSAGYWPLVANQVVALVAVTAAAIALGGNPRPRHAVELWGLVGGLLATLAVLGFLLATERGLLSISAVLTSLYPAATVLLASMVLREPIHRPQALGLALCAVTVVCVALG